MGDKRISRGRAFRWGARPFCAAFCAAVPWACGPGEIPDETPKIPAADGEAWDARYEISRPGLRIEIRAAYMREFSKVQQVRADSGVQVVFRDGDITSRLTSRRMVLDHRRDRFGLAGGVVLWAGDSLEIQADSLVWDGEDERLRIPGVLRVQVREGWERGRNLESGFAVDEWSMEDVVGHWRGRGGHGVEIRARREKSRRLNGAQVVIYDSLEVSYDGVELASPQAIFKPDAGSLAFSGGVQGTDSLTHFWAERVEVDLEAQLLWARGAVRFSEEDAELGADEVEEDREMAVLRATGAPATFVQGARHVSARSLVYERETRILEADGAVVFNEGKRRLEARGLSYKRDAGEVLATGQVVMQMPELEGWVAGDSLFYDLEREVGWVRGHPVMRRVAGEGDELVLEATILRFDLTRRRLDGEGDFDLSAKGLEVKARRGVYEADSSRVLVAGEVVLDQRSPERDYTSRLQADSMVVAMRDNHVVQIAIPGPVKGKVEAGGRLNWIEGRGGRVFMTDDDLERVEVDAEADVTHRHPEKGEVSRFRGERMTLYFDEEGLRRVLVMGAAELVTRLQGEDGESAVNEVSGEELEIRFVDGSISEVRIGPDIEGSYYSPVEER